MAAKCWQPAAPKAESASARSLFSQVLRLDIIQKRADFVRATAKGTRYVAPAFLLQSIPSPDTVPPAISTVRLGVTATRKLGGAVVRNRVKRRLRAAAREILPHQGVEGMDYVLVGRSFCVHYPYDALCRDLARGVKKLRSNKCAD